MESPLGKTSFMYDTLPPINMAPGVRDPVPLKGNMVHIRTPKTSNGSMYRAPETAVQASDRRGQEVPRPSARSCPWARHPLDVRRRVAGGSFFGRLSGSRRQSPTNSLGTLRRFGLPFEGTPEGQVPC